MDAGPDVTLIAVGVDERVVCVAGERFSGESERETDRVACRWGRRKLMQGTSISQRHVQINLVNIYCLHI